MFVCCCYLHQPILSTLTPGSPFRIHCDPRRCMHYSSFTLRAFIIPCLNGTICHNGVTNILYTVYNLTVF